MQLAEDPMGLVVFQMAHEAFSALAVAMGRGQTDMNWAVVIEPRNPHLLFRALTPLARRFCTWFRSFSHPRESLTRRSGLVERAVNAPQLWVPNAATVDLLSRWGRRFSYQRTDGPLAADIALVEFGRHLQFLGDYARVPGQALVVAATTLLRRHWVTGQSDLENENLAALDAWIEPPHGVVASEAARAVEDQAVGPLLQPYDENRIFKVIGELNSERAGSTDESVCSRLTPRLEGECRPFVEHAWGLLWRAIERERGFTPGSSVEKRWADDRRAYTEQVDWVEGGGRRRARDSARRAASLRLRLEESQERLDAQEALDDPLVMARLILVGKALVGTVTDVDRSHREAGPCRMVNRPLVTIETADPCALPRGMVLWWTGDPARVSGELVSTTTASTGGSIVVLKITKGMTGTLPARGIRACFSEVTLQSGPRLPLPKTLPWTHRPAHDPTSRSVDDPAEPAWENAT